MPLRVRRQCFPLRGSDQKGKAGSGMNAVIPGLLSEYPGAIGVHLDGDDVKNWDSWSTLPFGASAHQARGGMQNPR